MDGSKNIEIILLFLKVLCIIRLVTTNRDVAQFGSAPVLGTGGRRFESCHPETPLVQLVERWFPKPDVVGSSPTGRVIL